VGNTNVIYNKSTTKSIFQVNTRASDQIDLVFGDGSFANIPQGNYRLYYRVSNGVDYKITPDEMQGIVVPVNYISRTGRVETLTLRASLRYTVANASSRESLEEIRQKAPQQYYTQDRMVTGEDYNILPYTLFSNVLKVKAVNRTSSGISRYLDVIDTTGKYSSTNIFADDGVLYRDPFVNTFSFDYNTRNDIYKAIYNKVKPIASAQETLQFFYSKYPTIVISDAYWNYSTTVANGSTGYLVNAVGTIVQVGDTVANNNKYIKQSSIIKFSAGTNFWFNARNEIIAKPTSPKSGDKEFIYASVQQVIGDGTNGGQGNLSNGGGPVILGEQVPDGALAIAVYTVFDTDFSTSLTDSIVSYVQAYEDFGLRYDIETTSWQLILPGDLNAGEFNLAYAGNTSGQLLDASWLIRFKTIGQTYTVYYRGLNYVFESVKETNFYFDNTVKVFDPKTGFTVHDNIKILKVNSNPDDASPLSLDYTWYIYKNIIEVDGYENPSKILVTFSDMDNNGILDNPELFELIVNPDIDVNSKYVYFQSTYGYDNFVTQTLVSNSLVESTYATLVAAQENAKLYEAGQLFYIVPENKFYQLTVVGESYVLNEVFDYTAKVGRQDLYFQYRHNSPNYRRIDPSPNNIIDLYLLTKQYSTDYTAWIQDNTGSVVEPTAPTVDALNTEFSTLENYKNLTDTIIYNPAKFKPIFGAKAPLSLQATFKVVKNSSIVVSDNDIKTSVITEINNYFDVANWDFGETFYFSELSAYLHSVLAPNIASITIVPSSESSTFGSLLQINANYNEIIVSAATVDNVQIISAITAAQINQTVLA
jgi:hypothetical protein